VAIAARQSQGALHHYLDNDTPTAFDPLPEFSESYYVDGNPDVARAVAAGEVRNGYRHFLDSGRVTLRAPNTQVDLQYYAGLPIVRADLRQDRVPDAFTHYLTIGRAQGLSAVTPPEEQVSEAQGRALFRRKTEHLLPVLARAPLSFACESSPKITVVMPVQQRLAATLSSLASLRHTHPGAIELILLDCGGAIETAQIERFVEGAWLLRPDIELGAIRSRNAGLHSAGADAVLFLGDEVELGPGAVTAALRRLNSDPTIGSVGGCVIAADGRLHEAGGIIGCDGTLAAYCAGASPWTPGAGFTRAVDFCSSSFLLARAAVLADIDGFDAGFVTARFADADLGARIAGAGYRVVYDPAVTVHDYGPDGGDEAADEADRVAFVGKHAAWLAARNDNTSDVRDSATAAPRPPLASPVSE
jgi:GT2 family glycosyltransferase